MYHDPLVADHVLPAHVGDHSVDVAGHAPAGQVFTLHHVSGRAVGPDYHRHPQRALPQAVDTQNVAVGTPFLHPSVAQDAANARAQSAVDQR